MRISRNLFTWRGRSRSKALNMEKVFALNWSWLVKIGMEEKT
jgi:hypothetical protein